jgi:glycopeptide antibiotics resistance protein
VCDDFGMPVPNEKPSRLLRVLFLSYLVLLAWVILWKLEVPYVGAGALLPRPIKLVPFLADANSGASAPLEVLANVLFFVPFGFYLGLLAPSWAWWKVAGLLLASSLLLETVQHVLSIGTFDTSDVISNTVGGLAGLGLLALVRHLFSAKILARACLVFTVLVVVAAAAFIASPLHYSPSRDVIFPSPTAAP